MNIVVFGLPGSGKSYFAREVADRVNGLLISSDTVRRKMKQNGKYDDQTKTSVYLEMLALMVTGIKNHQNVVLDATFYKIAIRKLFEEKARELADPICFIEIRAAEETIKARLTKKRPDSEADFEVYLKVKQRFEPLMETHLILYSDREPIDEMLSKALAYLNDHTHGGK